MMMRVLLSNDDGIHAPGIQTLAGVLHEFANVQIIAPDRNRSGVPNSLTLDNPLRTQTLPNGDIAAIDQSYVSLTPLHLDLTAHRAHDLLTDWLNRAGVRPPC